MFSTVNEFCAAHRISRSLLYRLVKEGRGPRLTKINNSTRISNEAAAEWRERMERESEVIELTPRGRAKRAPALWQ
jgi:hypothetical protein